MPAYRAPETREEQLADVAEMYYQDGLTQAEISQRIGVTRSMVSRMLTEARRRGIIEIRVHRPLRFDHDLEQQLSEKFGLSRAVVATIWNEAPTRLLAQLGTAAANVLKTHLRSKMILGMAWGTAIRATVDALEVEAPTPITIVQMVGAGDSRVKDFDGHALVQRLAQKLGGEGIYLYAPIMVEDAETARSLLSTNPIRETIELARRASVALLGVGSTDPRISTLYHSGYFSLDDIHALRADGAEGNVCGLHFTIDGKMTSLDFQSRLVTIDRDDLLAIPIRLGVAGGIGKAPAILGALRAGCLTELVTDNAAAREILLLDQRASL